MVKPILCKNHSNVQQELRIGHCNLIGYVKFVFNDKSLHRKNNFKQRQ